MGGGRDGIGHGALERHLEDTTHSSHSFCARSLTFSRPIVHPRRPYRYRDRQHMPGMHHRSHQNTCHCPSPPASESPPSHSPVCLWISLSADASVTNILTDNGRHLSLTTVGSRIGDDDEQERSCFISSFSTTTSLRVDAPSPPPQPLSLPGGLADVFPPWELSPNLFFLLLMLRMTQGRVRADDAGATPSYRNRWHEHEETLS